MISINQNNIQREPIKTVVSLFIQYLKTFTKNLTKFLDFLFFYNAYGFNQ